MTIEAFVLAGGGSRRFGRDKARAELDGVPLAQRNASALAVRYPRVRIVSAPERSYDDLGFDTVFDEFADRGPLAGIHAALTHADSELVAIAACDHVGLDVSWYRALEEACGTTAAAFRNDRWHPLVAVYHRELLPEIERRLHAGELAVRDLLDELGTAVEPPPDFAELTSINTEAALASPRIEPRSRGARRPSGTVNITRHDGERVSDEVAVEEPLEIRLSFEHRGRPAQRSIAITMRTPGHDPELAVGFLFGEGIVERGDDIVSVEHCGTEEKANENVIKVELADQVDPQLSRLQRNFYTTSSCGVCGKSSLEALDVSGFSQLDDGTVVSAELIAELDGRARAAQDLFSRTGGLHAGTLFDANGELVCSREDVGRHNAVDKLIGWAVRAGHTPLSQHILFLSGRASFELLQKALAARIPIVCAVGAPSSLAVDLADRFGITLLGFVRSGRFNIYAHPHRIEL